MPQDSISNKALSAKMMPRDGSPSALTFLASIARQNLQRYWDDAIKKAEAEPEDKKPKDKAEKSETTSSDKDLRTCSATLKQIMRKDLEDDMAMVIESLIDQKQEELSRHICEVQVAALKGFTEVCHFRLLAVTLSYAYMWL
jgi:hypothetical protein